MEHAIWAHTIGEPAASTDIEVVRRWIDEGGLTQAVTDVRRAKAAGTDRTDADAKVVYGAYEEADKMLHTAEAERTLAPKAGISASAHL